jgi:hypothetical protein
VSESEARLVNQVFFYDQYLRERRRDRNYEPFGLRKIRGLMPGPRGD